MGHARRCPSRVFESRGSAQPIGGSTSGLTQEWKAPPPLRPAPTKPHAATSSTSSDAASRLKNGTCETMSLPGFRIALMRATNWRVDLRLDPRLESSATTASRSHQAARRHLIDILGRRFAAEKRDMRDDVPPKFQVARQRATNWRVDLRLDPRLESSASTASRSHQAARRHLIDTLERRFAAEKWDMRGRCPSQVSSRAAARNQLEGRPPA
jgi:hypothetical protein